MPIKKVHNTTCSAASSNQTGEDDEGIISPINIPIRIQKKEMVYTLYPSQPVLQIHIPSHVMAPAIILYPSEQDDSTSSSSTSTHTNEDFISNLLFPLPLTSFFDFCFRKHAVHIQSNNNNNNIHRIQDFIDTFLFSLHVPKILEHSSSENIFLWLRSPQTETVSSDKHSSSTTTTTTTSQQTPPLQSVEISDPHTAYLLHQAGSHAIYCRASPTLEQTIVPCLLQGTGLGCGQYDPTGGDKVNCLGRGEVEIFIGTQGHITGWHTDFQENFTIQCSGIKRWTFKHGTVKYPLRGITPHYHSPDTVESQMKSATLSNTDFTFGLPIQDVKSSSSSSSRAYGEEMQIVMNPGDVLYFPAGMWHTVETLEPGISINVSLMAMSYASLICTSLEHVLLRKNEWRETVWNRPIFNKHDNKDGSSIESSILNKVDDLLDDLSEVITQFNRYGGGSASIVPPSLRYPMIRTKEYDIKTKSENDESSNSHDEDDKIDVEQEEEDDDDDDQDSNKSKENIIISVSNFSCPSNHWSWKAPSSNHILVRNPLASLISFKDIKSFYSTENDSTYQHPMYVLNVNFAGNDSHESLIRVLLEDDTTDQSLNLCCEWESKNLPIDPSFIPPPCLIYYGYLVWIVK